MMCSNSVLRLIATKFSGSQRACSSVVGKAAEVAIVDAHSSLPDKPSQAQVNGINLPAMPGPDEELKPGAYLDKDGVICIVPSVGYKNPHEFLQAFTPKYTPNLPAPRPRKTLVEKIAEEDEENKPVWTEASREEIVERFRRFEVRTIDVVDPNVPLTVPIMSDDYGLVVMTNNRPGEPLVQNETASLPMFWFPVSKKNVAFHVQKKVRRWESLRTMQGIRYHFKWMKYDKLVENQKFVDARFYILGPELSAAHFLVYRGASVKFKGKSYWHTDDNFSEVPTTYEKGWDIEEVDATDVPLVYEGLQNLRALKHIKYLNLTNCKYVDDWCLDRIAGEFRETLVNINLTGCERITSRGLASLGKIKTLKHVELGDRDSSKEFHLTCLLLEDLRHSLYIEGVKVDEQLLLDDVLKGNPTDGPKVEVGVKEIGRVLSRSIDAGNREESGLRMASQTR